MVIPGDNSICMPAAFHMRHLICGISHGTKQAEGGFTLLQALIREAGDRVSDLEGSKADLRHFPTSRTGQGRSRFVGRRKQATCSCAGCPDAASLAGVRGARVDWTCAAFFVLGLVFTDAMCTCCLQSKRSSEAVR